MITGWGTIDGRKVFVFSQDFTVFGGALGEVFAEKIHKVMDLALQGRRAGHRPQRRRRRPHPGGRRRRSPATAASSTATCWRRASCRRSRVILGPCAGGAVYSPAMTDFIFMVDETSHMFITGPDVVKTVTGEEVTLEELGGAMSHASQVGRRHVRRRPTRRPASTTSATCSSFLPSNNLEEPPHLRAERRPRPALPRAHRPHAADARTSPTT